MAPTSHVSQSGYRIRAYYSVEVDHAIPRRIGGRDHPRNYILMSSRLNGSFGGTCLDEKMAILDPPLQRKVYEFARDAEKATKLAFKAWVRGLPPAQGTIVLK